MMSHKKGLSLCTTLTSDPETQLVRCTLPSHSTLLPLPPDHHHPSSHSLPLILLLLPLLPHVGVSRLSSDHWSSHIQHSSQSNQDQTTPTQTKTHPLQVHSHSPFHATISIPYHNDIKFCSFYSSSGSGFEAFFTNSLILVVAVATKKEFTTLALSDYPLSPLVWVSQRLASSHCLLLCG